jgi:hypothetical protein
MRAMTIVELLEHDHDKALALLAELAGYTAATGPAPRALVTELERVVDRHARCDHAVLDAALAAHADARPLVERSRADCQRIDELAEPLGRPEALATPGPLAALHGAIRAHTDWQRRELFPALHRWFSDAELERLFDDAERRLHRQSLTDSLVFPARRFGIT